MYHSKYKNYGKLKTLSRLAVKYSDQLYEYFGIQKSYKNEILIKSVCPIHGGDNPTALNLYYNGDYKIHYKCRTHQCEEIFGNDFIGFIRGALSRLNYNWEGPEDKVASFSESVEFLLKFLDQDFDPNVNFYISPVKTSWWFKLQENVFWIWAFCFFGGVMPNFFYYSR